MSPIDQAQRERDFYVMVHTVVSIPKIQTVQAMNDWWTSEKPIRERYGIIKDTPEYDKIVAACRKRKAELQQKIAA